MITKFFTLSTLLFCPFIFGQTILHEDFENGIPSNWEIKKTNATENWKTKGPKAFAYLSSKIAVIDGDNINYADQNEWLITPFFDLSNAKSPAIDFTIASNPYWLTEKNTTDFFIKVSIDGGKNWEQIWDDTQFIDDGSYSFKVYRIRLDLEKYKGEKNVQVAFQLKASGVVAPDNVVSVLLDDVTINAEQDKYCSTFYPENKVFPITRVKFANIDHHSEAITNGKNSYENFTNIVAEVNKGESYEISIESTTIGPTSQNSNISVFIDWNQNGLFLGPEEIKLGQTKGGSTPLIGSIKIPEFAKPGLTRMRIVRNLSNAAACSPAGDGGQVEDYSILIKGASVDPEDDGCTIYHPGSFENGSQVRSTVQSANDFNLEGNKSIEISKLEFTVSNKLDIVDIHFYKDNNGKPGELIKSFIGVSPSLQIYQDIEVYNNKLYKNTYTLPSAFLLNGEKEKTTYWIGLNSQNDSEINYWSSADIQTNNTNAMVSTDNGANWRPVSGALDGAFVVFGKCSSLGTNDIHSKRLTYYPNPVKDNLNIKSTKEIAEVNIINLTGQVVKRDTIIKDKLSTSNLPSGTFIIKIIYKDNSSESFKIIKK
ncbi:GEVED domain-containing protein [Empedobacter tilapiae]|uniref:T9SS type A sorting domain-containing protein n=1 Tax=Empedobacter tilapiae TaxID=2491114 RepID=A0A4Z1BIP1_9FLAO|nr:GEVED domain-containing protein [Empedobacter tilapiae]TGN29294.1 T9SS type A sorting domain-containing protein [Empedobacter tilapiae]